MFKPILNLALFDVKLRSPHKDLLLIKGNEFECDSVLFEGNVKLLIPEDIHVKKIKLRLIGEFSVECLERLATGAVLNSIIERLCVLKVNWPNLLTDETGIVTFGNYGDNALSFHKVQNLKRQTMKDEGHNPNNNPTRPKFSKSHSSPNFSKPVLVNMLRLPNSGIDGTPFKGMKTSSSHSFLLPRGNYSIPFSVLLPANVAETVEGLSCASLLYKLECTIERGRFEKPITKLKHVRIVRTLHPQNLNLVDTIDIDNAWLGKVQYNVKLNRKGVAVGSNIAISLTFIPMTKGLSLKAIKGSIIQQFSFKINGTKTADFEQQLCKQELEWTPHENSLDTWVIKTQYKVPEKLKGLNQSCDFKGGLVRVRHRLRLSILLRNKEGHISELRANLPIWIYISVNTGQVIGKQYEIHPNHGNFIEIPMKEHVYFKKDKRKPPYLDSPNEVEPEDENEIDDIDLDREDTAPPLYNHHNLDPVLDTNNNSLVALEQMAQPNSPVAFEPSSAPVTGYFDIPKRSQTSNVSLQLMNQIPTYEEALDEQDDQDELTIQPLDLSPIYDEGTRTRDSQADADADADTITDTIPDFRHFRSKLESRGRRSASSSGSATPTSFGNIDEISMSNGHKSPIHMSIAKMFAKRGK
jgi:hypothetical protein